MIHLLNKLHITITIIKQIPNFLLQKITVWKTKGNRQCLGVEERAYKQHRWASKILLSSIAKSKHFKTMSQAPEKSWNLLIIHETWKITYFSNARIIVQAHSLPNCLSVVLPHQFWESKHKRNPCAPEIPGSNQESDDTGEGWTASTEWDVLSSWA